MSKDINFNPGSTLPSTFLNEDQEADTGLVWGGSLRQITTPTVTVKIPTVGDAQASAVIGGKKRWVTADEVSASASGVAGNRNIYLTSETNVTTFDVAISPTTPTAGLTRQIGTAYYDGVSTVSAIRLMHGVQADADQYNSFIFRPIATSTGETPLRIHGWDGQANVATKLLSVGAGTASYVERFYVTGIGTTGVEMPAAADIAFRSRVTGDTAAQYRYTQDAAGKMTFADSAGANNAVLERTADKTLKLTNTLDLITVKNTVSTYVNVSNDINLASGKNYFINGTRLAATDLGDTALLARLAGPAFTGVPTAPTAAVDTNTTQIATTAYVVGQAYLKAATAASTYAALASPALTGTPTAPTAAVDTNTTQIATTAYVVGQGYAKLASPTFTGTPTLPTGAVGTTQSPGDSTTKLATTAFVAAGLALKADLASPALTGTPTAPTATGGTNTTQIATTAFVAAAVTSGTASDASTTTKGITKVSVAPASAANPISVGDNDPRVTADQAAGTASIRTLGTGALQAAVGNHVHGFAAITGTIAAGQYAAGSVVNADLAGSIAVTKLVLGGSNTVLLSDGVTNSFSQITDAYIAAGALIAVTKLALGGANTVLQSNGATNSYAQITDTHVAAANKDGVAGTASLRTLGTGATQAAAGNHVHGFAAITGTIAAGQYAAGSIVNADLAGSIALTKLVAPTDKQVIYGNGTTATWASADTAGLVDKINTQTGIGGNKTFTGALTFSGTLTADAAATFKAATAVGTGASPAALTITSASTDIGTYGGKDLRLTDATADKTASLSYNGLTFGTYSGTDGLTGVVTDWTLTRTAADVVELGTNDTIRDNRAAGGSWNAQDLVNKTYVDTEIAKVTTKVRSTTTSTDTGVTNAHDTVFVNYAGAVTITLSSYSAVGNTGKTVTFKDISGGCSATNTITIDANSTETIDGSLTYVLNTAYEWVTIQSNGTNWFVVG